MSHHFLIPSYIEEQKQKTCHLCTYAFTYDRYVYMCVFNPTQSSHIPITLYHTFLRNLHTREPSFSHPELHVYRRAETEDLPPSCVRMHSRMIATYTCACLTPPKVHALCIIMRVHKRVRLYEHGLRSRATAYIRTDELHVEILILFLLQLLPLHVPQDQKMGMSAMIPVQPWSLLICAHTLMLGQ